MHIYTAYTSGVGSRGVCSSASLQGAVLLVARVLNNQDPNRLHTEQHPVTGLGRTDARWTVLTAEGLAVGYVTARSLA